MTSATACIVPGCPNEVVRVLVEKRSAVGVSERGPVSAGLCAHHVRRAILYLRPEQVRDLVFPAGEP